VLYKEAPIPGALFDFGLFFFHNAHRLMAKGTGPYFYIPKLESHLEARLWNDIFAYSEEALGVAHGSIKATVLIETIPAVFEMDEILYELRDYIVGLNCGRWDYLFSFIKCFREHPEFVLPDRAQVTMNRHFLRSYSQLLIKTCHRRGAFAMGGMAAQIPIKGDPQANAEAIDKVRADKEREVREGHDGTWVAHPGLVPVAMEVFDSHMPQPNQLDNLREDVDVNSDDLLRIPEGQVTQAGLRNNVSAALRYMAAWLGGQGAVPIHHLMEDVATAEIARAQLWQWIRFPKGVLEDGARIDRQMFEQILHSELAAIREELGEQGFASFADRYERAAQLLRNLTLSDDFAAFLTLQAYQELP
jgi:malate synthase